MNFDFCAALAWIREPSSEFISALIGAIVGGLLTMLATLLAHKLESRRLSNEKRMVLNNTLCLLKEELATAWEIYSKEYAAELLQLDDTTPYLKSFPIGANTFPIYDSAPSCLADAPPEITREIIRIYMRTKGLITMIEANNSDFASACEYGRSETERLRSTIPQNTLKPTDEYIKLLDSSFIKHRNTHAVLLGMGSNTESLKNITIDITSILNSVTIKIDKYISTPK